MDRRNINIVLAVLLALAIAQEIDNQQSDHDEKEIEEEGKEEEGKNEEMEEEVEDNEEASGEAPSKRGTTIIQNIGYLLKGYNILRGNPMDPSGSDPGFANPIFEAEYKTGRTTADRSYKIPDNTDVIIKKSCRELVTVNRIMTKSEYQQDLQAMASVSATANVEEFEGSFTASTEYNRMSKKLESNDLSVIKNEAACVVYEASIQTATPPPFTENFATFVKRLNSKTTYVKFLDTFGTHFIQKVDMGARYIKLDEMTKETKERLQKDDFAINTAAEASLAGIGSVSSSSKIGITEEDVKKYKSSLKDSTIVTIGSALPANGDKEEWRKETFDRPEPVLYSLKSIVDLFDKRFFKIKGVNLKEVRNKLLRVLKGYCKVLKTSGFPDAECEGPPKDCGGGSQCSVNAKCTNASNSRDPDHLYQCTCKKGFQGDGRYCQRETLGIPTKVIEQDDNRYDYGIWGGMDLCTNDSFASGFSLRVDRESNSGDQTGANAICITCNLSEEKCSRKGIWGDWSSPIECPKGSYLSGWRQNVEPNKGWGLLADDTALNNVEYECRDLGTWEETKTLMGDGYNWGTWSRFKRCPKGQFICGVNTRVAPYYYDDTALTDITHQCCSLQFSAKKMARMFAVMAEKRKAKMMNQMKKMTVKGAKGK